MTFFSRSVWIMCKWEKDIIQIGQNIIKCPWNCFLTFYKKGQYNEIFKRILQYWIVRTDYLLWLINYQVPSHYFNQCWLTVNYHQGTYFNDILFEPTLYLSLQMPINLKLTYFQSLQDIKYNYVVLYAVWWEVGCKVVTTSPLGPPSITEGLP